MSDAPSTPMSSLTTAQRLLAADQQEPLGYERDLPAVLTETRPDDTDTLTDQTEPDTDLDPDTHTADSTDDTPEPTDEDGEHPGVIDLTYRPGAGLFVTPETDDEPTQHEATSPAEALAAALAGSRRQAAKVERREGPVERRSVPWPELVWVMSWETREDGQGEVVGPFRYDEEAVLWAGTHLKPGTWDFAVGTKQPW